MIFKNIIRPDLEEFFKFTESEEEEVQITYMDVVDSSVTDEDIRNLKKSIIRELRLSKLLDGDDVDEKIDIINKIEDPNIWNSDRRKKLGFGDDNPLEHWDPNRIGETKVRDLSTVIMNKIISLDGTIEIKDKSNLSNYEDKSRVYTSVYNTFNDEIEELLIKEYRNLAIINRVKMEEFHDSSPLIVDASEEKKILAKIALAANNIIMSQNRIQGGDLLIMNPILYNKMKPHFKLLKIDVFQSKFMKQNEILVTIKPNNQNGNDFIRFVYNFKKFKITSPDFTESRIFRLKYGIGKTSNKSESNCVLITLE